jgi:hypothetical protein
MRRRRAPSSSSITFQQLSTISHLAALPENPESSPFHCTHHFHRISSSTDRRRTIQIFSLRTLATIFATMKVAATALLVGAATAATFQQSAQKVFSNGKAKAHEVLSDASRETKALWNDLQLSLPDSFDQSSWFSKPKPHSRKPNSAWDYVVDGTAVQAMRTRDASGQARRVIDGALEQYSLRGKKVDPSKLGVDTVKQYSGYLDDEANDKHLFYCKIHTTT